MTQYEKKQLLTYLGAVFLGVGLISAFLILLLVAPWLGAIVGFIGMGAGFLWRANQIRTNDPQEIINRWKRIRR